MRKIRPNALLRAAAMLQKQLDSGDPHPDGCCDALMYVMNVRTGDGGHYEELHKTPEYILLKELYRPKRESFAGYWFGAPTRYDRNGTAVQHKQNQETRIQALLFAYEVAVRLK